MTNFPPNVIVNGKREKIKAGVDGYVSINRQWKDGDKVRIELPMKLEIVPLNEATHYLALKYGPIVLAARISDEHLSKDDFRSARSTVAMKDYPVIDVPGFYRGYPENTGCCYPEKRREAGFFV